VTVPSCEESIPSGVLELSVSVSVGASGKEISEEPSPTVISFGEHPPIKTSNTASASSIAEIISNFLFELFIEVSPFM